MLLRYDQGCSHQYELISLACVSSETHNLQGVFFFLRIYDKRAEWSHAFLAETVEPGNNKRCVTEATHVCEESLGRINAI